MSDLTMRMRRKYAPRGKRNVPPPGTHDINELCYVVDSLEKLLVNAAHDLGGRRESDILGDMRLALENSSAYSHAEYRVTRNAARRAELFGKSE